MIAGALLAFAALIVLLDALVYGLAEAGLERWLAALIVGGVVAVIGFCWCAKARTTFRDSPGARADGRERAQGHRTW